MEISRTKFYLFSLLSGFAIVLALTLSLMSKQNGITGQTEAGCSGASCHGSSSGNTSVTVSSSTGSFTVDPGDEVTFTVTVSNSGQDKAGLNFGVKDSESGGSNVGSLSAGTGTKVSGGEITHTQAQDLSGGEYNFTFSWTAPSAHGEYWLKGAGNAVNGNGQPSGDEWNLADKQKITVAGVTVSSPNGTENWCIGEEKEIVWDSDGISTVTIEVSSDNGSSWDLIEPGVNASSGSYTWEIEAHRQTGDEYLIRISDDSNSGRFDVSDATFSLNEAVSITSQPESKDACTGEGVTFAVGVEGSGHSFQWRLDGSPISGATSNSYTIDDILEHHEGDYDCVITGPCGDQVTSNVATLTLTYTPQIVDQPQHQSACEGEEVTLSANIGGEADEMQWYKDGNPISGANSESYVIPSAGQSDEGEYYLEIINNACNVELQTDIAELSINITPVFNEDLISKVVCAGDSLKFEPKVSGTIDGYQWYRDGEPVSGQNSKNLIIPMATLNDAGRYKLVLQGACGEEINSKEVLAVVNGHPEITTQPQSTDVLLEESVTLSLEAENPGGHPSELKYQWFKDGNMLTGETGTSYEVTSATMDDAGTYYVEVKNKCDLLTKSDEAELEVIDDQDGPAITVNQNTLNLGPVAVGKSNTKIFEDVITNSGTEPLQLTGVTITGPDADAFEVTAPEFNVTIVVDNPLEELGIKFAPTKKGSHSATLKFKSSAINNPSITLTGSGGSAVTASVTALDFGNVQVGDSEVLTDLSLSNGSESAIPVSYQFSDDAFSLEEDITELPANSDVTFNVVFSPAVEQQYNETLTVSIDGQDDIVVNLTGEGKVTSVYEGIPFVSNVKTYPNPTTNHITFEMTFEKPADYQVKIVDLNGKTVKTTSGYGNIGPNQFEWDGRDEDGNLLSSGTYFGLIQVGDKIEVVDFQIH